MSEPVSEPAPLVDHAPEAPISQLQDLTNRLYKAIQHAALVEELPEILDLHQLVTGLGRTTDKAQRMLIGGSAPARPYLLFTGRELSVIDGNGEQVLHWVEDEWVEAPEEVVPAILQACYLVDQGRLDVERYRHDGHGDVRLLLPEE